LEDKEETKMEIRLAERHKGRMKNIEIYSENDFKALLSNQVNKAVEEVGTFAKFFPGYADKLRLKLTKNMLTLFRRRLQSNLNR
jgi:hypothetical protein